MGLIVGAHRGTIVGSRRIGGYWGSRFPSNLTVTVISPTQLRLDWINNGVADFESIIVRKKLSGGEFSQLVSLGPTINTYTDIVADSLVPCWYLIMYYKSDGYSPPVGYQYVNNELQIAAEGLSNPISDVELGLLDDFITSIKTGLGITAFDEHFDVARMLGGPTEEFSLRNITKDAHHLTKVGSPTFVEFEGWTGNVAGSAYLTSDYQPSVNAVRYALNDCAIGMYNRTAGSDSTNGAYQLVGTSTSMINSDPAYYNRCQMNDTSYGTITVSSNPGLRVTTRRAAGRFYHNVNGTESLSGRAANALPNSYERIGYGASSQVAFVYASKGETASQIAVIRNAVEAYMDAHSKGVL